MVVGGGARKPTGHGDLSEGRVRRSTWRGWCAHLFHDVDVSDGTVPRLEIASNRCLWVLRARGTVSDGKWGIRSPSGVGTTDVVRAPPSPGHCLVLDSSLTLFNRLITIVFTGHGGEGLLKKMTLTNTNEAGSLWVDYGFNDGTGDFPRGGSPVRSRGRMDQGHQPSGCVELQWQSGHQAVQRGSRQGGALRPPAPGHPLRNHGHPEQHVPAGTHSTRRRGPVWSRAGAASPPPR